jgi:hypothetical protein
MNRADFAKVLCSTEKPSLEELGGLAAIMQFAPEFVTHAYAERLVDVLLEDCQAEFEQSVGYAIRVLSENQYPPLVSAVAQKLSVVLLSREDGRLAQDTLLKRAGIKNSPFDAGMASECMLGAFFLAAEKKAPRSKFVAALEDFSPGDDAALVSRVALLAGLAWCWDGSEDVEENLKRLATDSDWGAQAAFELGMIEIDCALCSQDRDALFARLSEAVEWFKRAEEVDGDFVEATSIRATLRALMLFCDGGTDVDIDLLVEEARESACARFDYLDSSSMRQWLRPRLDVQTTWYELSCALLGLSKHMAERSWLRALPALERIADLRSTLVRLSTSAGDALRETVTNRLALGFVAREGLRAHLYDWSNDVDISSNNREHARALLDAVEQLRSQEGKVAPLASADGLVSGVDASGALAAIDALLPGARQRLTLTVMQEQCVKNILSELELHPDYRGKVRADVNQFVVFLMRFLTHCINVGYDISNRTFSFLFEKSDELPLEKELQAAMFHWLQILFSGFESHKVIREPVDVARGRADLAVICDGWRMVAELKREWTDASPNGLAKYLGQAGTYSIDGPRISFLVVLDLCEQKNWPLGLEDNCWVEKVQTAADSVPRIVVVFRIPGRRPVPSSIETPAQPRNRDAQKNGERSESTVQRSKAAQRTKARTNGADA